MDSSITYQKKKKKKKKKLVTTITLSQGREGNRIKTLEVYIV